MFLLGEINMAYDSRRQYGIMKSKSNREIFSVIHQEAQRWYVFVHLGRGAGKAAAICKTLQNKIQPSYRCSWTGLLLAFDKLGTWDCKNPQGIIFPFMLMKHLTHIFFSSDEGWRGGGLRCCWASVLRKWSRIPCLWLGIINAITACLEAPSFLGKDPRLADSSSQCGGWWKGDPAEASARRPFVPDTGFRMTDLGPRPNVAAVGFPLTFAKALNCSFSHSIKQMRLLHK